MLVIVGTKTGLRIDGSQRWYMTRQHWFVGAFTILLVLSAWHIYGEVTQSVQRERNLEAVREDIRSIASFAHEWYDRPAILGGGQGCFERVTFKALHFMADEISADGLMAVNRNGVYTIARRDTDEIVLLVEPRSNDLGKEVFVVGHVGPSGVRSSLVTDPGRLLTGL
jgi:hypothetical protein